MPLIPLGLPWFEPPTFPRLLLGFDEIIIFFLLFPNTRVVWDCHLNYLLPPTFHVTQFRATTFDMINCFTLPIAH